MKNKLEIKKISEREFRIGESRYFLDDDGILYIDMVGESDANKAGNEKKIAPEILKNHKGKVNLCIDLNKCKKISPEARKIYQEMSYGESIGKIALWGLSAVSRIIASFGMGLSRKKDMRFFKTKEDALLWLKDDK